MAKRKVNGRGSSGRGASRPTSGRSGGATSSGGKKDADAWKKKAVVGKKAWKTSRKAEDTFGEDYDGPDGIVAATLTSGRVGHTEKAGVYCGLNFTVSAGDYKGKQLSIFQGHLEENEVSQEMLVKCLKRLGLSDADLDIELTDLDKPIAKLNKSKPEVQLNVRQNGQFQNVYVNKLIDAK